MPERSWGTASSSDPAKIRGPKPIRGADRLTTRLTRHPHSPFSGLLDSLFFP
jgi:hypothetical protein